MHRIFKMYHTFRIFFSKHNSSHSDIYPFKMNESGFSYQIAWLKEWDYYKKKKRKRKK